MKPTEHRFITVERAASKLGISPQRIRQLLGAGRVRGAMKLSPRVWLIPSTLHILPPEK